MTGRHRVVLASSNPGKLREFEACLGEGWSLVAQSALGVVPIAETSATFAGNALLKARHASAHTGLPALADDSGLEVDALGGAPGVRSARFAGPEADDAANNELLLRLLVGTEAGRRTARFRCVLVLVRSVDDPAPLMAEGLWEGRIATTARGRGGFGYDPVFEDPVTGLTAAELPPQEKNTRSHRGGALAQLRRLVASPVRG